MTDHEGSNRRGWRLFRKKTPESKNAEPVSHPAEDALAPVEPAPESRPPDKIKKIFDDDTLTKLMASIKKENLLKEPLVLDPDAFKNVIDFDEIRRTKEQLTTDIESRRDRMRRDIERDSERRALDKDFLSTSLDRMEDQLRKDRDRRLRDYETKREIGGLRDREPRKFPRSMFTEPERLEKPLTIPFLDSLKEGKIPIRETDPIKIEGNIMELPQLERTSQVQTELGIGHELVASELEKARRALEQGDKATASHHIVLARIIQTIHDTRRLRDGSDYRKKETNPEA